MSYLLDPKVFNYIIMALYCVNAMNWYVRGSVGDAWYWLSALSITAAVTWGYSR